MNLLKLLLTTLLIAGINVFCSAQATKTEDSHPKNQEVKTETIEKSNLNSLRTQKLDLIKIKSSRKATVLKPLLLPRIEMKRLVPKSN